jgi:hypothetical protein
MKISVNFLLITFLVVCHVGIAYADTAPSFSLVVNTPANIVKSGDQVLLHVVLTNTSKKPLVVWEGAVFYDVDIVKDNGNIVPEVGIRFGKAVRTLLKPGGTQVDVFVLNSMYDIYSLGTYVLRVSRSHIQTEDGRWISSPVSNLIRVTVTN